MEELSNHAESNIITILIGNKVDLDHLRGIHKDEALVFC